jgi:hypothetical protein
MVRVGVMVGIKVRVKARVSSYTKKKSKIKFGMVTDRARTPSLQVA